MSLQDWPQDIRDRYEVHEWKHATAILKSDFPDEYDDVVNVLSGFRLVHSHFTVGGGGKSKVAGSLDEAFYSRGWREKSWDTKIVVDDHEMESPTHKVDCYKNQVGLEIEWSNKDPFYDRDLNNFRLLFDLRVISVGIIITKSNDLLDIFKPLKLEKFGTSTTWMRKLLPRIEGGGGGGCPILVFGITKSLYIQDTK
jgi:hypothetical protein